LLPRWKQRIFFGIGVAIATIIIFLPILPELLGLRSSLSLYTEAFEFNACLYYVSKGLSLLIWGVDKASWYSGRFTLLAMLVIALLLFKKWKGLEDASFWKYCLFAISSYLVCTTVVHPWYILVPLVVSIFTSFRYPVVWSFVVLLSYWAYINTSFEENYIFIFIEYLILITFFVLEFFHSDKINQKLYHT